MYDITSTAVSIGQVHMSVFGAHFMSNVTENMRKDILVGVRSLFGRIPLLSAYQDEQADATFSKCTLSPVASQRTACCIQEKNNSNLSTPIRAPRLQLALCDHSRPQMGGGKGSYLTSRSTSNRIPL